MNKQFVEEPIFTKNCRKLGITDSMLDEVKDYLLTHATIPDVIPGTGGARKLRLAVDNNKGKSGGARIIYLNLVIADRIHLLNIYKKSNQENLTQQELKQIKKQTAQIKHDAKRKIEDVELVVHWDVNVDDFPTLSEALEELSIYDTIEMEPETYINEDGLLVLMIDCTSDELDSRLDSLN